MRCLSCNKRLTEFESTVKYASTGEYVDLCNGCRRYLPDSTLFIERSDLASTGDSDIFHEDIFDQNVDETSDEY